MKRVYTTLSALLHRPLGLLALLLLPALANATHYTTLTDGNYYNVTNVWSTDGATPCFCSPTDTINGGDTLDILAQIMLGGNVVVRGGGVLNIYTTGSLYGSFELLLDGAQVNNQGILSIGSLIHRGFGFMVSTGTLNVNPGDMVLESGQVQIGGSAHVGGNLLVSSGIFLQILDNAALVVDGNYNNGGITRLGLNACVTVIGNFSNTYVVFGDGHIGAQGSMTNFGDWVSTISWCAGGTDSGIPGIEDCVTCSGPLPVALGKFEATFAPDQSAAALKWNTLLESNNDAFLLARSTDGKAFTQFVELASTAPNGGGATYTHFDTEAPAGDVWYQLSQRDKEGKVTILATQRVRIGGQDLAFSAWPNPFSNSLRFSLNADAELHVGLRDLSGRLLLERDLVGSGEIDASNLPAGIYLLEYKSGSESGFVRVSKQ